MLEALKVSKFTPKAPRIQTELVKSSRETQNAGLESGDSQLWSPLLYRGVEPQVHCTHRAEQNLPVESKPNYTLENIANNSLVSQDLLQSPLAVFRAQIAAFQQSKFNKRKEEAPLGLFSSELWPGELHSPAFPSPEPGSSSLGSQELKWMGLNFRTGMTWANSTSAEASLSEENDIQTTTLKPQETTWFTQWNVLWRTCEDTSTSVHCNVFISFTDLILEFYNDFFVALAKLFWCRCQNTEEDKFENIHFLKVCSFPSPILF